MKIIDKIIKKIGADAGKVLLAIAEEVDGVLVNYDGKANDFGLLKSYLTGKNKNKRVEKSLYDLASMGYAYKIYINGGKEMLFRLNYAYILKDDLESG